MMAQSGCRGDENSQCLSSNAITNTYSCFGNGLPVNSLISQIPAIKTSEELPSGHAENTGSLDDECLTLNQLEKVFSAPIDVASALRSVALMCTLDFGRMHFPVPKLFTVPELDEKDNGTLSPSVDQDEDKEWAADPVEEEVLGVSFQSKYIHDFPLYQDYCLQAVRVDLHRVNKSFLSGLLSSHCLPGLQAALAPRTHFEDTSSQPCSLEVTPSSPPPQCLRVTPCTLWQDLDEVKACGLLKRLTTREIRLQEAMFELIGSEASYLRSLRVAVTHFYTSKTLKKTLSKMEHHILFSNLRHVMAASEKFLMDLEVRLGESVVISQVGDIVLQHCPTLQALYVPYVTNMMYQESLINQLLQQKKAFLFSLKKLESDPVCQRQSLKSFLVLPFQRITRLKLIMESILRLTEPDSDSTSNLKKAIEAVHKIVTECDKGIQKMKQIEELVCLEMLLDFSKVKSIPLVVSGRFLVHKGPLRQLTLEGNPNLRNSFVDIYLHLFNDLLIISSKKEQRFSVVDYAAFPAHVHMEQLKTDILNLPPGSFLLHLSQNHTGQPTALILATHTRPDEEAWMKVLSSKR